MDDLMKLVESAAAVWDRRALEAELAQASAKMVEQAARIQQLEAALREIVAMDEVAIVDFKKGDGWLHQRVARAALEAK